MPIRTYEEDQVILFIDGVRVYPTRFKLNDIICVVLDGPFKEKKKIRTVYTPNHKPKKKKK